MSKQLRALPVGVALLAASTALPVLTSCKKEFAPRKEQVTRMVWKSQLKEAIMISLYDDLSKKQYEIEAAYDKKMQAEERSAEVMNTIFSGGLMAAYARSSSDKKLERLDSLKGAECVEMAFKSEYGCNTCLGLIDKWDFAYKPSSQTKVDFYEVYNYDMNEEQERYMKDYIAQHQMERPNLSDLEQVQDSMWVTTNLNTGRKYLVSLTADSLLSIRWYKGGLEKPKD